jgi:hypothetical protein
MTEIDLREKIDQIVLSRIARSSTEHHTLILRQASIIPPDHNLECWPSDMIQQTCLKFKKLLHLVDPQGDLYHVIELQIKILEYYLSNRGITLDTKISRLRAYDLVSAHTFIKLVKAAKKTDSLVEIHDGQWSIIQNTISSLKKNDQLFLTRITANLKDYNIRLQLKYLAFEEEKNLWYNLFVRSIY